MAESVYPSVFLCLRTLFTSLCQFQEALSEIDLMGP